MMNDIFKSLDYFNGIPLKVDCRGCKKQKKTSNNRFMNWILGKMYGYETEYFVKDMEVIQYDGCLIMNPVTYRKLKGENNETVL